MKPLYYSFIGIFLFFVQACTQKKNNFDFKDEAFHVYIEKLSDTTNRIVNINHKGDSSYWNLPYPVYQCKYADIDSNGLNELIVGVIKTTRFDQSMRKRVFVFKHYDNDIRPLWLGSSLGMPIKDFDINEVKNQLVTIEYDKDNTYAVANYEWDRFGFKFMGYTKRNCSFELAKTLINEQ